MVRGLHLVCVLSCFAFSGAAFAAPLSRAKPAAKPVAPPAAPEAGWTLERGKDAFILFYGLPNGADTAITFACVPRSGDVTIRVPEGSGKATIDQSQSVSLTIGGVRSSFAGRVVDDPASGGAILAVIVPARSPMFTALGGPGGMRIEGKGIAKIVPLRMIGEKLKQFLGTCRKG